MTHASTPAAAHHAISLRPLRVADAPEMTRVLSDPDLYRFTGGQPPTQDELARRYAVQVRGRSGDGTQRWVNRVIVLDGRAIGYVQATVPVTPADKCSTATSTATVSGPAEVAWVVGTPWQGRGYATRAAQLLADELYRRGVRHLVAHVHPDHHASTRVARHLGLSATDVVVDGETRWGGPCLTTGGPGPS